MISDCRPLRTIEKVMKSVTCGIPKMENDCRNVFDSFDRSTTGQAATHTLLVDGWRDHLTVHVDLDLHVARASSYT